MQIGCPPETIKDSISLGLEVPRCFVVMGDMFSTSLGLNTAELEFPAYYNFFIKRRRTMIITTKRNMERLKTVFQETLLGPKRKNVFLTKDFAKRILCLNLTFRR